MFPGRVIADRYRILRVLGRGGMGVVCEVVDLHGSERCAIKFLREDVESELKPAARFRREAKLATRLTSPHACRVIEIGDWELGPFIVMELLEGCSLTSVLNQGRQLHWPVAARIAFEMCDALSEAHGLGIVHRDVKSANVFLARLPDGKVVTKVLDFGVAKIPASVVTKRIEPSLTDASLLLGTPSYVAPEQLINSKQVDARADIWAVGILLYEMLTGRLPFTSPLVPKLLLKIARERPPLLTEFAPTVPSGLVEVVHRCLEKAPSERFADARSLADALESWIDRSESGLTELLVAAADSASPPPDNEHCERTQGARIAELSTAQIPGPPTSRSTTDRLIRWLHKGAASTALGLVFLVALVVVAALLWHRHRAESYPPSPLQVRQPTESKATVHFLSLVVDPVGARVTLDQSEVMPLPARLPIADDGALHELVAAAPGFITERRRFSLHADQEMKIALLPLATAALPPASSTAPRKRASATEQRAAAPPSSATGSTRLRGIDRLNPY